MIDLSNGQKVTTSALYFAAALCKIEDIYCSILHTKPLSKMVEGKDCEYIRLGQVEGIERLAKVSYFDLIYYVEDLKLLISEEDCKRSSVLKKISDGMLNGITGFFSGTLDSRSIINGITIGNGSIARKIRNYLNQNDNAVNFINNSNVKLHNHGPIDDIRIFFSEYLKHMGEQTKFICGDPNLVCLSTTPGLLYSLRDYRNISAHYSESMFNLSTDDVRTVVNMQLQLLKYLHANKTLWEQL